MLCDSGMEPIQNFSVWTILAILKYRLFLRSWSNNLDRQPIYVDLDGTLVRTDLLVETALSSLRRHPWTGFAMLGWVARGPSVAKVMAARYGRISVENLPYDLPLIAYLGEQKKIGRLIYLATASHGSIAKRVANHLGLFDGVIASTAHENIKGKTKLARIIENQKEAPFVYAGDSNADRPIWNAASAGIFVRAPNSAVAEAKAAGKIEQNFPHAGNLWLALLRALRPHQWAKNALLFLPLLTSQLYDDVNAVAAASLGFIAFCLVASSGYLLNDLLDLDADRRHLRKRKRPFASGDLPLWVGIALVPMLLVAAIALSAWLLPPVFVVTLALYYISTCLYSLWLKRVATVDVMTLAGLYTNRVLAGAVAIAVMPSFWILAFSMFLFLSLAYLKRYTELRNAPHRVEPLAGRGYASEDAESTFTLGSVSGVMAVLVMALYINSPEVSVHYANPQFLWVLCLALLYWINRIWIGARRGRIHDDPVVFALTDRVSIVIGTFCLMAILAARFLQL